MARFGSVTDGELESRRMSLQSTRTLNANKASAKLFREYLCEKGRNNVFECMELAELDFNLSRFYMDLRRRSGDKYRLSSMESIRHGLNRYLKQPPQNKKFDIVKDAAFNGSNTNFKVVLQEIKKAGLGNVNHFPVISESDLKQLYGSLYLNTETPQGLLNKVQFDVRLYFCRRGNENMVDLTKEAFSIEIDPQTKRRYVKKRLDEMTKNHRQDKEATSGVMPEIEGSPYCPVNSFEKYISKLNLSCNRLWQKPRDSFLPDEIWYCNVAIGEKKLKIFMSTQSKSANLSQIYTNHSIRATGATILSKNMFGPAQVMSVTGHKSVQSLTVYQRVNDGEKIQMGDALAESIVPNEYGQLALASTSTSVQLQQPLAIQSSTSTSLEIMPLQPITNICDSIHDNLLNPDDIFSDFNSLNKAEVVPSSAQVFNNCTVTYIQNLTIRK